MEIIGLYTKNLMALHSINQISKSLDKKYPYINKKVTALIAAGIFRKIEIGRSYLCSLNLSNPRTIILLSLYHISRQGTQKNLPQKFFDEIKNARKQFELESVVYSGNKIFFVTPHSSRKDEILSLFSKIEGVKFDVLSKHSFSELFLSNKSVYEDHLVLYGYEKFYEIIYDIEDKLKVKYSPLFKNA